MIDITRNRRNPVCLFAVVLICSLFALGFAPTGRADTTYTYTGQPFDTFVGVDSCTDGVGQCKFSISFTVASSLPGNFPLACIGSERGSSGGCDPNFNVTPLAFSMTDGVTTLTADLGRQAFIDVGTSPSGQIDYWYISAAGTIGQNTYQFISSSNPSGFDATDTWTLPSGAIAGYGYNQNKSGVWTVSTTPEPSSQLIFGIGLLGMAGARRWKKVRWNP